MLCLSTECVCEYCVTCFDLYAFDKINVIKEMLNVKYDFASVPVLDLAEIVYSIEFLCTE